MSEHLLSLMTFFPLLGMIVVLLIPRENEGLLKGLTLVFTLITFCISLPLAFDPVFKT
ncbi:MAG: Fe-S-binding domain-containing protein, partial [Deltaproteobacteria bacterium]